MTRITTKRTLLTTLHKRLQELEEGRCISSDAEAWKGRLQARIADLEGQGVTPTENAYPMGISPKEDKAA